MELNSKAKHIKFVKAINDKIGVSTRDFCHYVYHVSFF